MNNSLRCLFSSLLLLIILYGFAVGPFTRYMREKPIQEKLGYLPSSSSLQYMGADQRESFAAFLVLKVMMYFGTLTGDSPANLVKTPPDYKGMSRMLHGAVKLDPYNMDAYYFAQAFLTWDVQQYKLANDLLDYGMKYRTWDWMLPFFAGFNNAYFLKDYTKAAQYYRRAGELSGSDLHLSLAGRYMQEAGQTDLAISYLSAMVKSARNAAVRSQYQTRLTAFREVRRIELARDRYRADRGRLPDSVEHLIRGGYLVPAPVDPYGGRFYFSIDGKVTTTSKFAFGGKSAH